MNTRLSVTKPDPDEGQKDFTGEEFLRKAIKELGGPNAMAEVHKAATR